jgi:hypothetical protein
VRRDPDLGEAVRRVAISLIASLAPFAPLFAQSGAARLEGTVTDSIHAAPFAGATVRATRVDGQLESTLTATADRRGRYRFDRVTPGRYAVGVTSSFLDSLEYGGPVTRVDLGASGTTRVDLGTPSRATLQARACPGAALPGGTGALLGTVTSSETDRPLAGARVAVAWSELAIDTATQQVTSGQRAASVTTDENGQYRMCGVPMAEWLVVQVQHADRAGAVVRTSIGAAGVTVRNLSFSAQGSRPLESPASAAAEGDTPPLPEGDAVLAGTVLRADGAALAGAQVQVLGTAASARTDERGAYTLHRLPAGTLELEVRRIGFAAERRTVELRGGRTTRVDVRLERAVALDSVAVVARRLQYPEFESHRRLSISGRFLDQDEIDRRHASSMSEIVYTLNGFWVVGSGPGARVVSSQPSSLGGSCEANIVIDRMPEQRINDVSMSEVAAVEAYPGGRGAPPQYRSPCGVIMIWTKR